MVRGAFAQPAPINRHAVILSGLAASSPGVFNPTNIAHAKYWWVSVDVTNQANVTNWPDRVQSLILTNGTTGATRPTITAANLGVHFARASAQILTNLPGFSLGQLGDNVATIWWIMNADSTPSFADIAESHGGDTSLGIYTANQIYYYKNPTVSKSQVITTGHYIDAAVVLNVSGTSSNLFYTNGIPAITNTSPLAAGMDPTWLFTKLGSSVNGSYDGYIREFAFFSNQALSSVTISNLHYYATNKYSYTP